MCGRTCLTLAPDEVVCACKYPKKATKPGTKSSKSPTKENGEEPNDLQTPEWRSEFNCGRTYTPSYNIAPTDITPVLVSSAHFAGPEDTDYSRVVVPMMWGMIPFWHKGDYRRHGLTTNNCRLEHMAESKLYRGPFQRGQRCVVVCEGFYEWQTTKSAKPSERAAHLIYMQQAKEQIKIYDRSTWQPDEVRLLRMAGLFDVWEDENGDKIYSYSIITFQSSKIMSWMHYRMPAILQTEQEVDDWLDFKRVTNEQALAVLKPATEIKWHQVANVVNNSRNKSDQCNKPIEMTQNRKIVETAQNRSMLAWLNVRKRREQEIAKREEERSSDNESASNRMQPDQLKREKDLLENQEWYDAEKRQPANPELFTSSTSESEDTIELDSESDASDDDNPPKRMRTGADTDATKPGASSSSKENE